MVRNFSDGRSGSYKAGKEPDAEAAGEQQGKGRAFEDGRYKTQKLVHISSGTLTVLSYLFFI